MDKLAIQLIAAFLVVLLGRKLDWHWWLTTLAVIVSAVCIHLVYDFIYERLFGHSTRHLGAAAISNDDPLMLRALEEAKQFWPQFLQLFREYPKDSLVKFRFRTNADDIENVWGDLLELGNDTATVYLRTPPVGDVNLPSRQMKTAIADIVDWQVMVRDGTLRGGFTQQATFRIMERENGALSRKFSEQLSRYRSLSEPIA